MSLSPVGLSCYLSDRISTGRIGWSLVEMLCQWSDLSVVNRVLSLLIKLGCYRSGSIVLYHVALSLSRHSFSFSSPPIITHEQLHHYHHNHRYHNIQVVNITFLTL